MRLLDSDFIYRRVLRTGFIFTVLVFFTGSVFAQSINIVRYDTICPGETGCHTYMDTLFYEDWEGANSSCWIFDKNNSTYIDGLGKATQLQAKQVPTYRFPAYQGKSLFEASNKIYNLYGYIVDNSIRSDITNAWGQNMLTYFTSTATSPSFKITNPSLTTVSFYYYDEILGEEGIGFDVDGYPTMSWSTVYWYYDLLNVIDEVALYGSTNTSNIWHLGGVDIDREHENIENYDSWKQKTVSMSSLSAGNNTLKFYHINHGGIGFGVDNILVYGPRCIEIPPAISSLPAGSHKTTTETVVRYGCTPTTITTHWYVSGISDTTIVSTIENPYTWNGNQYTTSGIYSKPGFHNQRGCDSTAYLDLTILDGDIIYFDTTVCETFYWANNDSNYIHSTIDTIQATNRWGADSLTILRLTVNHGTTFEEIPIVACDSVVRFWNQSNTNQTIKATGTYFDTLNTPNAAGCDSIHKISIIIIGQSTFAPTQVIASCDTFRWEFNNRVYIKGNTITDTLKGGNSQGCDSIAVLDLTISYSKKSTSSITACDSFYWTASDSTYTLSTTDSVSNSMQNGCDSIARLILTLKQSSSHRDTISVCDTVVWHPHLGKRDTITVSETYYDTIPNAAGCDSVQSLNVTIHHSIKADTLFITKCDSMTWTYNSITYKTSNVYADTLTTVYGCDSIAILDLTINHSEKTDTSITACDSYYWADSDSLYTLSTTDSVRTTNQNGCDSIVHLILTLKQSSYFRDTLSVCDTVVWHPHLGKRDTITLSGTYYDTVLNVAGCDSVQSLHVTIHHSVKTDTLFASKCDSMTWAFNGITYDTTNVYADTLTNIHGCDSIAFLSLTIYRSHYHESWDTLCDSFYWSKNNRTYTQSLDNATEIWETEHGCDSSIILHITIIHTDYDTLRTTACDSFSWHFHHDSTFYASTFFQDTLKRQRTNSCDSIRVLQLTLNHSIVMPTANHVQCDSLLWDFNQQTYFADTVLTDTIPTRTGCDSIATLHLTINHSIFTDTYESACDSFRWVASGKSYRTSGNHTIQVAAAGYCDSIKTLHLTILRSTDSLLRATACDTFVWRLEQDNILTMSGTFQNTIKNAVGCDSVRTLQLVINHSSASDTQSITSCNRYVWPATNTVYFESGTYSATLRNKEGCDSLATIRLTVSYNSSNHLHPEACDSFYWEATDSIYTASTVDTLWLLNQHGCDSLGILNLKINHATIGAIQNHTACEQYVWHVRWDIPLTSSGLYQDTLTNSVGCDSIVRLRLTIYHNDTVPIYETICDNKPYVMFGQQFVTTGDYPFRSSNRYSCDSLLILHLTVHPTYSFHITDTAFREDLPYYFDGKYRFDSEVHEEPIIYTTTDGCDSIYYLTLFVTIRQLGCDQRLVFPNVVTPNGDGHNDRFCVIGVEDGCYPINELFIYNRWGALVFHSKNFSSCADAWEPNYMPAGTYFYRFQASNVFGMIERQGVVEVIKD